MGLISKARAVMLSVAAKVMARYESALYQYGERSYIFSPFQDARFDLDSFSRSQIAARAREWERNSWLMQRLADLFEQYVAGPYGLAVIPNSSEEDFNQVAGDWWSEWSLFPDLTSRQNLGILQNLMARRWFIEGEIFIMKSYSPDTGRPRIQLIESHHVGTPPDKREQEGVTVIDGVKIDRSGRPIGYYVLKGTLADSMGGATYPVNPSAGDYELVSADDMIHLFEPSRPGQYRGVSFFHAVLNDLHDLMDLHKMEMMAAKDAAAVTNVVTNASGEVKNAATLRRQPFPIQSQNQAGQPVVKRDDKFYQDILGGRTVVMKTGEKMEQFRSDRPSVGQQWWYDFIVAKVCAGVGISRLLVLPFSLQGTVARSDLQTSSAFFRSRSQVLSSVMSQIYCWVMGWAEKYDKRLDGAPKDFLKHKIRPPRSVSVDVGYDSNATLAELQAGVQTYQDVYAERGEDWREQLLQKAEEADYINKLLAKFPGVTRDQIVLLPKQNPQQPQSGQEEEPEKQAA